MTSPRTPIPVHVTIDTTDPYAHGTPAGDFHTWVKPASEPCPDCECCAAPLCERAIERDTACHLEGSGDYDLSRCPCWPRGSQARARAARDHANPKEPAMTTTDTAVLACERCLTRPAARYDTHTDRVVCRTCQPSEPPSAYDCEFVTSIPADLPVTYPPRPVLPGGPDEPTVDRWAPADTDHTCPGCGDPVRAGDLVAVLATSPPSAVCEHCIDY